MGDRSFLHIPRAARRSGVAAVIAGVAVLSAGCGGGSHAAGTVNTALAGQLAQGQVPGAAGTHSSTSVPLAAQNTLTALFTAINNFQSCLNGLGVTFIGIPDASNPNSPTNDPTYVKNLTTCAVQSNILQALQAASDAQKNLTLSQIKTENKQYLKWRTCMIGRGWTIPPPKPNAQGLLFSFGDAGSAAASGNGGGIGGIVPPPGKTLLSTTDFEQCAAIALG